MISKVVIALGLISIMLPMLAYGQTCSTAAQCTSGCCQLNPRKLILRLLFRLILSNLALFKNRIYSALLAVLALPQLQPRLNLAHQHVAALLV
jgi:hypothetical protein